MITLLLRVLVVSWLLGVGAVFVHAAVAGPSGWTTGVLLVLIGGHAIVLAVEFGLMAVVNRHEPIRKPTWQTRVLAWMSESFHAPRVFAWLQPFQSRRWMDTAVGMHHGQRGVLLVHGFVCNRGVWNDWLKRLHGLQVPFIAVNLDPPWVPIDRHVNGIERAVAQLEAVTGLPPVVVAHSMGGLAARRWWQGQAADRIHRLITLGTPHQGTLLAQLGFAPNVRQMRPGCGWLRGLADSLSTPHAQRTTCFYSNCDNVVMPGTAATLRGASNHCLDGVAHLQMIGHTDPWSTLLQHLDLPLPGSLNEAASPRT